jgi:hypothetical protein
MSIIAVTPLAAGSALRVFLLPPASARLWRVLRKQTDDFVDQDDAAALRVYQGTERAPLDAQYLNDGTTYYYRAYYWDGSAWSASNSAYGVPAASFEDASTDVPSVVRDRLEYGFAAEVAAQRLQPGAGLIRVLNAPPLYEDTGWPVVTVHLQSEGSSVRGLGELVDADDLDELAGDFAETEGWLAKVQLTITAWSLNPDERKELRKALRRIIVANLGIFDDAGMVQIDVQLQDMDAVGGEFPAPVYQVMCTLSCLAPVRVITRRDPAILDVTTTIVEGSTP